MYTLTYMKYRNRIHAGWVGFVHNRFAINYKVFFFFQIESYLAFLVFSESVRIFQPFMTGMAHAATGCNTVSCNLALIY